MSLKNLLICKIQRPFNERSTTVQHKSNHTYTDTDTDTDKEKEKRFSKIY
jgi:hypothetical protein